MTNKRPEIEQMLAEGKAPEEIADLTMVSLRYVYQIKALAKGAGKEEGKTLRNHVVEIKDNLKSICKDIHKMAKEEEGYYVVCPAEGCGKIFFFDDGTLCDECGVLFCGQACIAKHRKTDEWDLFGDGRSQCQKFEAKIAEKEGKNIPSKKEDTEAAVPEKPEDFE